MRIGRIGRGLGLALAVLTALSVMALPAAAAAAKGTASIAPDQRQALAGEVGADFDITVSNPAGPGGLLDQPNPSYNHVVIVPPANAYTATAGSAPSGTNWTSFINNAGQLVFDGGTIADGQSATFSVTADVARIGCDLARTWKVYVSDNAGQTLVEQNPASPGALRTEIRVLQVTSVELIAPVGVVDDSATQEQTGITARTTVANAGSQDLTTSATLGKGSGSAGAPTTSPADANPKTILSGTQSTFDFDVTMGSPGNLVLAGDASVTDCADALNGLSDTISVMTKAALSYVGGSLNPTHVVPGEPYGFSANISKSGQVAVSLDLTNSEFLFPAGAPDYVAPLLDNGSIEGGNQGLTFNFAEQVVPLALADGSYDPQILVVGTDENGAPVGTAADPYEVPISDDVVLDRLIPIVKPTLTPPTSSVVGAEPATTNGKTLSFGGTIEDPSGTPCGACTIESAFLVQKDDAGNVVHQEPVNPTNSAGMIGGSFSGTYNAAAVSVQLHIVAADQAGNAGPGTSDAVEVDLIDPTIDRAISGGPSGQDARRVDVFFNELVRAPVGCSSLDWTVDDNVVTASECEPTPAGHDHVILTLQNELDHDAEPGLTYSAAIGDNNRRHDRVDLEITDPLSVEIRDGLLPELPVLEQVSGLTKYDGQFWTNQASPEFLITNVVAGHTIKVLEDANDNGQIDAGDSEIASGEAQGNSVTLAGSVGNTERDIPLLVQALDTRLNSSPLADELLTVDLSAPEFDSVQFLGDDVIVTFTDVLRFGRDFGTDWTIHTGSGMTADQFKPGSVSGSREQRTLSVDSAGYSSTDVTGLEYQFSGPSDGRYLDRAGNALVDFRASVTGA